MKMSNANIIKSFILIICMLLTACGKTDDIVTDYGVRTDNSGQSDNADKGTELTGGQTLSANGKTVRDMLGTNNIEIYDNFDADGIPVEVDTKCPVPDISSVSAYQLMRVDDGRADEGKIVDALFGDTKEELSEIDTVDVGWDTSYMELCEDYHSIADAMGIDLYNGVDLSDYLRSGEEDYDKHINNIDVPVHYLWSDEEDYYIHLYKGVYEGVEYGLIYAYSYKYKIKYISFRPVTLETYFPDEKYEVCSSYNEEAADVYGTSIFSFYNKENECKLSDEEMIKTAKDFLSDKLMLKSYDDMLSFYDDANVYSGEHRSLLGFSEKMDGLNTRVDRFDGNELFLTQKKSGIFPSTGLRNDEAYYRDYLYSESCVLSNGGRIRVTSRGILSVSLSWQADVTDVTENISLLKADNLMECFRTTVQNNIEKDRLGTARQLYFNRLKLCYYPVGNPDNDKEYTFVPTWEFTATAQARAVAAVYINAIDGSLIEIAYSGK